MSESCSWLSYYYNNINNAVKRIKETSIINNKIVKSFVVAFIGIQLRNWYCNYYRKANSLPPGPNGLPFIGSLFSAINLPKFLNSLYNKYGSITMIYIGYQPYVFLHEIDVINKIFYNKYALDREWNDSLIFQHLKEYDYMTSVSDGKQWKQKRQVLQSSMKSVLNSKFINNVHNLSLKYHVSDSLTNNIWYPSADINYIQFNVTWAALFGIDNISYDYNNNERSFMVKSLFQMANDAGIDIVLRHLCLDKLIPYSFIKHLFPTFRFCQYYIEQLIYKKLKYDENIFDINDIKWTKYFSDVNNENKINSCIISKLINFYRCNPPLKNVTNIKNTVIGEILNILNASIDTTIHVNEYGITLLAKYPQIQEKLYIEISSFFKTPSDVEDICKLKESLNELHYLRAFIYEVLRLSSVLAVGVPHFNKDKPIHINNYIIPKQSVIMSDTKTASVYETYWVKKAKELNGTSDEPNLNLWIDQKTRQFKLNIHKNKFMAFGVGPRECAGSSIGLINLYLIFIKLIYCYKFDLQSIHQNATLRQHFEFTMVLKPKIPLLVSKRQQ